MFIGTTGCLRRLELCPVLERGEEGVLDTEADAETHGRGLEGVTGQLCIIIFIGLIYRYELLNGRVTRSPPPNFSLSFPFPLWISTLFSTLTPHPIPFYVKALSNFSLDPPFPVGVYPQTSVVDPNLFFAGANKRGLVLLLNDKKVLANFHTKIFLTFSQGYCCRYLNILKLISFQSRISKISKSRIRIRFKSRISKISKKSHPDPVQKFLNPNQQPHTRMYVLYNVQTSTIGLIDFEEKNWTLAMLCQIVLGPQFAF